MIRSLLTVVLLVTAWVSPASAQTMVKGKQSEVRLIADRATVGAHETLWVGLHIHHTPGWHTYWRTPGDAGAPTTITWTLPEGFRADAIQWPPPMRVPTDTLMNFAYEGDVTLVVPIHVEAQPGPAKLEADASWYVCTIGSCIPEDGHFVLPLTVVAGPTEPDTGPDAALLAAARASIPKPAPFPVTVTRRGPELVLTAGPGLPPGITSASLFPDGDGVIDNAGKQQAKLGTDTLTLRVPVGEKPPQHLGGVLVLEGASSRRGYEMAADVGEAAAGGSDMTIWIALAFALLGGLILNVMPCVLPVLVMKALGMIARRENHALMRRDALIYAAGVVTCFTALVALLLVLRGVGNAIGWGFQLQNPIVVAALANIMLALGLSLSGVFVIGGGIAGLGQGLASHAGGWGSFFTGVLAVVVAAPCTAPFMAPALGFALTQPPAVAIAVFEGLALGLALPYLLIAFIPALAGLLPRPGVWMERLKQILAFGLYGSAAWLVWVLSQQLSATGLAFVFASLLAVGFAAWCYGIAANAPHRLRWLAVTAIAIVVAGATIADAPSYPVATSATSSDVEPFTPERLAALRTQGRPVLVNFTAAWCITCLVNERVALSRPEVQAALRQTGVAYLKGDWTNRNADITAALHNLDRVGVPVYALYPPEGPPQLLPQVLTPGVVIDALKSVAVPSSNRTAKDS